MMMMNHTLLPISSLTVIQQHRLETEEQIRLYRRSRRPCFRSWLHHVTQLSVSLYIYYTSLDRRAEKLQLDQRTQGYNLKAAMPVLL